MHDHCMHCDAAHQALLDQIVEHKVQLEEMSDRVAELELALDEIFSEAEDFESEDDEEDEDE